MKAKTKKRHALRPLAEFHADVGFKYVELKDDSLDKFRARMEAYKLAVNPPKGNVARIRKTA